MLAFSLILGVDAIHNILCLDSDITVFRRCPQIQKPQEINP